MKHCRLCKQQVSLDQFTRNRTARDGLAYECGPCRRKAGREYATAHRNPERSRIQKLKLKYQMTPEQFEVLVQNQKGLCAICDTAPLTILHIDHDHSCCAKDTSCGRCIRGLLCAKCNKALGLLNDNPVTLLKAAAYVEKYKAA